MRKATNSILLRAERGAALVLALLVMLVLSGLGLVAMHSTSEGTSLAGMHRLQSQSKSLSDAINQLGLVRSGRQASALNAQMRRQVATDSDPGSAMRRGGYVIFTNSYQGNADDGFTGIGDAEVALQSDGGLFSRSDFVETIDEENVVLRYIVRDPVMGPPVPGFSDEYCFIGVAVGSWANMDLGPPVADDSEARARARRAQALGRNLSRAYIGPIECQ